MEGLVKTLGIEGISRSQASRMAKTPGEMAGAFRSRPLCGSPYTYLWLDALTQKVREGGRVVNISCTVAIAVNAGGHREVLGCDLVTTEDGAGWTSFLRGLVARGLSGVRLVVSDAHSGLAGAIASCLPGATWQRCRTHFARKPLCKVPKASQDLVATAVRSIFAQPDKKSVLEQHAAAVEQMEARFAEAAEMLDSAKADILVFTAYPKAHWRQIWSNNPLERLNREIRRRTGVACIFPDRAAVMRLVGAVLAEQDDEWQVARRYMSLELLAKARLAII